MAGRGGFAAISPADAELLQSAAASDGGAVRAAWDDLCGREGGSLACPMDKAWRVIHSCLIDRRFEGGGQHPLDCCVLGGEPIAVTDDGVRLYLKEVWEVSDTWAALAPLGEPFLRPRWLATRRDEGKPTEDKYFEYALSYFMAMREFYRSASEAGLAVVFEYGG
jgi:hypothetical protein